MEEGDASASTPKTRRGSGAAIYEKYLNIKQNALSPVGAAASSPAKARPQALPEISNSTDEQELEAGEVVSTQENDAASGDANGIGVSAAADSKSEPVSESKPKPTALETAADTPQSLAPAAASNRNQLTAVGTSCAADASPDALDAAAVPDTAVVTPSPASTLSPSAAAFERARAPALSNPSSPSRSPLKPQYAGLRTPVRMTNNGRDMGPEGPPRGRSRSRSRGRNGNGMPGDMNGNGRPRSPVRGPPGNGRFDGPPRDNGHFNGPPGNGFGSPRGGFGGRGPGSPRGGFGGRSSPRGGFNGPPGGGDGWRGRSPPPIDRRDDFRRSPGRGPPRDFRDRPGPGRNSPPRGGMMGDRGPGGPRRSRSRSPPRGPPRSPPRNGNGSPSRGGFYGRGPGSPRGGFRGHGPGGPPPFDDFRRGRPPSPSRGGGFDRRFDDRGPPPMNGQGPPNMFPPRGRSRSRSPNRPPSANMMRKRDRSWDRGGPPPDMMNRPFNRSLPDSPRMMEPRPFETPSEWSFDLKRSGRLKCRCKAISQTVGFNRQLPLYLDVVQLPHLNRSSDFLQLERPHVRRVVYELMPDTMADSNGYREFRDYLIQGRGGHARAGSAMEMEPQGFKIFILPPGQAARQLGYKADNLIAVLRAR